jgi:hypothetical protein
VAGTYQNLDREELDAFAIQSDDPPPVGTFDLANLTEAERTALAGNLFYLQTDWVGSDFTAVFVPVAGTLTFEEVVDEARYCASRGTIVGVHMREADPVTLEPLADGRCMDVADGSWDTTGRLCGTAYPLTAGTDPEGDEACMAEEGCCGVFFDCVHDAACWDCLTGVDPACVGVSEIDAYLECGEETGCLF